MKVQVKKIKYRGTEYDAVNEKGWPFLRVNSGGDPEYECSHGVGHGGIHGCDGCCHDTPIPVDDALPNGNISEENEEFGKDIPEREHERRDRSMLPSGNTMIETPDEFDLMCGCQASRSEERITKHLKGCLMHYEFEKEFLRLPCGCEMDPSKMEIAFDIKGCKIHTRKA